MVVARFKFGRHFLQLKWVRPRNGHNRGLLSNLVNISHMSPCSYKYTMYIAYHFRKIFIINNRNNWKSINYTLSQKILLRINHRLINHSWLHIYESGSFTATFDQQVDTLSDAFKKKSRMQFFCFFSMIEPVIDQLSKSQF
jgi:hypothetical protein